MFSSVRYVYSSVGSARNADVKIKMYSSVCDQNRIKIFFQ